MIKEQRSVKVNLFLILKTNLENFSKNTNFKLAKISPSLNFNSTFCFYLNLGNYYKLTKLTRCSNKSFATNTNG